MECLRKTHIAWEFEAKGGLQITTWTFIQRDTFYEWQNLVFLWSVNSTDNNNLQDYLQMRWIVP
jgi:hypothetical protein